MPDKKIHVFSYSGYRAHEIPRAFMINNQKIEITDILDMWIEEKKKTFSRKRVYKVKGDDGFVYTLYFDEKETEWFLQSR
jgi:hypothetical protein